MKTISQTVAEFVLTREFRHFPPATVHRAKRSLLDCLGVALAGTTKAASRAVREQARDDGGSKDATVWGSREKVPAEAAALVNGVSSHVLDYDDTSFVMLGHPSAVVCPAVVAVGEMKKASGTELITAYIVGMEVACRVGGATGGRMYSAGWHNTSTAGIFGAAAGAAKLLRLSQDETAHSLGLAAAMASGTKRAFGSGAKPFQVGQASSNGVRAALLAGKGLTSAPDAMEGKAGFAELFSGSSLVSSELGDKMGKPYCIEDPGLSIKRYPSCYYTHTAIDAVLEMRHDHHIEPGSVASVECGAGPAALDAVVYKDPEDELQARFSMPFCLATALIEGRVMLSEFTEARLHDAGLRALMAKVRFFRDAGIGSEDYGDPASQVRITMKDGTSFSKGVLKPKGHPENPLSDAELLDKYSACVRGVLGEEEAGSLAKLVLGLEELDTMEPLVSRLSF